MSYLSFFSPLSVGFFKGPAVVSARSSSPSSTPTHPTDLGLSTPLAYYLGHVNFFFGFLSSIPPRLVYSRRTLGVFLRAKSPRDYFFFLGHLFRTFFLLFFFWADYIIFMALFELWAFFFGEEVVAFTFFVGSFFSRRTLRVFKVNFKGGLASLGLFSGFYPRLWVLSLAVSSRAFSHPHPHRPYFFAPKLSCFPASFLFLCR